MSVKPMNEIAEYLDSEYDSIYVRNLDYGIKIKGAAVEVDNGEYEEPWMILEPVTKQNPTLYWVSGGTGRGKDYSREMNGTNDIDNLVQRKLISEN